MAKDVKPTAAEKGKGKAVDEKLPNGDGKTDGSKSGADGKLANGKKGGETHEGRLSTIDLGPPLHGGLQACTQAFISPF